MPVICTKDQDKLYETITTRLYSKTKEDISNSQTFKTFSITKSDTSRNTKILSGTAIQNSTLKAGLLNARENDTHEEPDEEPHLSPVSSPLIKEASRDNNEHKMIAEETYDKNSIISGSQKLQDLKNLHRQLRKSSIEPETPLFEPRRPTLEAIRDAIERAKKLEINRHKNVGTDDDDSTFFLLSDASTSTESRKTKKKTKKKKPNAKPQSTDISLSPRQCLRKPKKSKKRSRSK